MDRNSEQIPGRVCKRKKDGILNSWESPENLCASVSGSLQCSHIGLLSTNEEEINAGS